MINNSNIYRVAVNDRDVILLGTAHVSKESAELAVRLIEDEKPDTVCVELCESRYQSIREHDRWLEMDIIKVIKEKKAFLLLANLLLASFQRRIADKLGIKPGEEMIKAVEAGEAVGAQIHLADRDIRVTLARTWRGMGLWDKLKLLFQLILSLGDIEEITEEDVEQMKQEDMLEMILADVGKSLPAVREILIDERDRYLAQRIKTAPGKKIVAVVGAGHAPGIKNYLGIDTNLDALGTVPPKRWSSGLFKWLLPGIILVLIGAGFFYGGSKAGAGMVAWWVMANGVLAGIGAVAALAHPLTILSSVAAAPLTSLNPMIAAGWVSGLVEAFSRKPKVRDFESLSQDILSIRGFWKNQVTRILLVVVFTNMGSMLGTMVAIPLMVKAFNA